MPKRLDLSEEDELALTIARNTVAKLVEDWQQNPCDWYSEIDIQSELRSRLATVFTILGMEKVTWKTGNQDFKHTRVQCEPEFEEYKPDLVIWGDKTDPDVNDEEWPALWACEIKYVKDTSEKDIDKLQRMIERQDILYGCALSFQVGKDKPKEPDPSEDVEAFTGWVTDRDC
ncbi:MAG: hypothetical protein POELPBGB_03804 [Bacteroidia bacterium]|nr:hypothetical protein [Bacteroidia bacterium]